MTTDDYIARVLAGLPPTWPARRQIALELRDHVAAGLSAGHPLDVVLGQLGDPSALAGAYLGTVELSPARWGPRLLAKAIDLALVVGLVAPPAALAWLWPDEDIRAAAVVSALIVAFGGFLLYTALTEWRFGQTLGKRLTGLVVLSESGAPITLGQALVRQAPALLQVFVLDAVTALVTDRRQRVAELLSKTRVVGALAAEVPPRA